MKKVGKYIIIVINLVLMTFFAGAYYNFVGFIIAAICVVMIVFFKYSTVCDYIIVKQIQSYDINLLPNDEESRQILISVAFLALSIKVGAALALFVEGAAAIIIAVCILLVSGWFFEGSASGMTLKGAYGISKALVTIYVFLNSLIDKIAMFIVNLEFSILGIENR